MFSWLIRRFSTQKTATPDAAEAPEKQEAPDTPTKSICLTNRIISKNDSAPLKSVNVDVRIEGFIANVRSTLRYKNAEKNPIEVRYEFPMDDESAMYEFEAHIEDRIIIAECQRKEQAKATYDDALKEGYGAVMMEEDDSSSDIFTCLVGNLPPDAEAVIKFGYVTELSLQPDGTICFLLPTILNPRYNPNEKSDGSIWSKRASHASTGEQPYEFDIKATIVNPGKIASVRSPNDKLDVKLSDDKTSAHVTLAKPFVPDHDLTLSVTIMELNEPHVIFEKGDDTKDGILKKDVIMLNFFPELKDSDYSDKHEIIFVIDRSGSMSGSRMEQAREALLLFLKSLPPGCYFNVVGFGSSFQLLFQEGSREYCEETLRAACEHQRVMSADLGGTEILEPLKHIYDKPPMATHCREVLIMTDGEVTNTQEVINLVKMNAKNTRLFSIGIGDGASTALVKGIARAGLGTAEFTKAGDRLQPIVVKTLKAALQPGVTGLHLDWQLTGGPCELVQMPKEMPPLFAGGRLIIYAMPLTDKEILDGQVQLKGEIGKRSVEFEIGVDSSRNISPRDDAFPIHRLAAKAQIKQLQDSGKDENEALIVLLSTAANVISCHTSMVGVDKDRKQKVVGDLMRRNVPTMSDPYERLRTLGRFQGTMDCGSSRKTKSKSFGINLWRSGGSKRRPMTACAPPAPRMAMNSSSSYASSSVDRCGYECDSSLGRSRNVSLDVDCLSSMSMEEETKEKPSKEPDYMTIVALQTFSGQWILTAELAAAMNTTLIALQSAAPIKTLDVWATVLALNYLNVKFDEKRDEWEMVETKAMRWLDLQDLEGFSVDDLLQESKTVVGQQ